MSDASRSLAFAVLALGLAGCETYQREKADLIYGRGQSQRLVDAQNRLDDARAEQLSLQEEQLMAQEELAALETELRQVNGNRRTQRDRLAQASRQAKISEAEERRLARELDLRSEAFNDKALELEAARQRGDEGEVSRREAELAEMRREIDQLNREIDIMAR
ncbi:MAG: hypothetical protein AAF713_09370 [Pseudomonadota bacterium]